MLLFLFAHIFTKIILKLDLSYVNLIIFLNIYVPVEDSKYIVDVTPVKYYNFDKTITFTANIFLDNKIEKYDEKFRKIYFLYKKNQNNGKNYEKNYTINFYNKIENIVEIPPVDYNTDFKLLKSIKNNELLNFCKKLNDVWLLLNRKSVYETISSSSIFLPHDFIVPGGRFNEIYYWDSYWILHGLMVCEMNVSVNNLINNLFYCIKKYGFIPNGSRKYYLNRSQPPFFILMLYSAYINNFRKIVLKEVKFAEKEYNFWMKNRIINVKDKNNETYLLNIYNVRSDIPRLESFIKDLELFSDQNDKSANEMFSNIYSAAESGWDFSSRWFDNENDMKTIDTTNIIPVDLNAILYKNEQILYKFFKDLKIVDKAKYYENVSEKRRIAFKQILWNAEENIWMDFNFKKWCFKKKRFYFSNIFPMIFGIEKDISLVYKILKTYSYVLFGHRGGIPASEKGIISYQQWDYPNVWAPHQQLFIEYLMKINEENMAYHVAKSFYDSVFLGYKKNKVIYEKYNCEDIGLTGNGGEYKPQDGFGWTNGTIFYIINLFKDKIMDDFDHKTSYLSIVKHLKSKNRTNNLEILKE